MDIELQYQIKALSHWEGRIPWPYLDSAVEPNVTIGVGCLISSADELRGLPMRRLRDGRLAWPEEVSTEFLRVRSMPGGLRAAAYRNGLYLDEPDIDDLAAKRLAMVSRTLPEVFPAWASLPPPARACLVDLAWNVGVPGLRSWRHLRAALSSAPTNWEAAACHCTVANPTNSSGRAARNSWRVSCMQAAAEGRPTPAPL